MTPDLFAGAPLDPGRQPVKVRCGACQHIWPAAWLPMEMDRVSRVLKGVRCPACGEGPRNIFLARQNGAATVPTVPCESGDSQKQGAR